jgi:general secretion pathway protein K
MNKPAQHGAALLAAMLTVTMVATLAAAALWQQWRNVEVEAAERSRVQSAWILNGALDWARLILREDRGNVDHLGEPWGVPLQEARLSTFLAADQSNNSDTGDANNVFLSGDMTDLQSRLDIHVLHTAAGRNDKGVEAFGRLFEALGLPQSQLAQLAENIRFAADISIDNRSASRAPLMPQRVGQLVWLGLSPETVAALEPYVTVIPVPETGQGPAVKVNLNTAPAEVIYAVGSKISLADARKLVAQRERQPFRSMTDVTPLLPAEGGFVDGMAGLNSTYFEIRGRLRIDDVVIEERSIVQRSGSSVRILRRERGASESLSQAAVRR